MSADALRPITQNDASLPNVNAGAAYSKHGRAKRHPLLRVVEPAFAVAGMQLADAITDELLHGADVATDEWVKLAEEYPDDLKFVGESEAYSSGNLLRLELVQRFLQTWIGHLRWPIAQVFGDGVEIALPADLVASLRQSSSLLTLRVFLASVQDVCCATMASDDGHLNYRLYVNVPIWIPIAVVPQFRASAARQMRMIMHHEMAHIRWCGGDLRNELIAHARGVAFLARRSWPRDRGELQELFEKEHPEAWNNAEVRSLVMDTHGGARLIHAWGERRLRADPKPAVR